MDMPALLLSRIQFVSTVPFHIIFPGGAGLWLGYMLLGAGLLALPLTLIYTPVVYFVFKGKTAIEPLSY